jgi:hypothetical protein
MDKFNYSFLVQLIVKWVCHIRIKIIHVNREGPSWLWQWRGLYLPMQSVSITVIATEVMNSNHAHDEMYTPK